jgi:hypothetical protein
MDTVDVLTMAVDVARMIRSAADPEAVFVEACRVAGCSPGDSSESLSVRVTRLVENAGERRSEMNEVLRQRRRPLYLNRPLESGEASAESPVLDPELSELLDYVDSEAGEADAIDLLGEGGYPYKIGSREMVEYIDLADVQQPPVVRGLVNYPVERPVLFSIEAAAKPWYRWHILTAFSDQYARIYEDPARFGVWGHDLEDLWIEGLSYFPAKRLIYPTIDS